MSDVAKDCCLQCGKSREHVKDYFNSACATETGYECIEGLDEWPKHHWRDWSDKQLAAIGVLPEAFDRHRRDSIYDLEYVVCDDTVRGHTPASATTNPEWGYKPGQCMGCGFIPTPTESEKETK